MMIGYEQVSPGQRAVVALLLVALWGLALGAPFVRAWWERVTASDTERVWEPELVDWETNGWTSRDDEA